MMASRQCERLLRSSSAIGRSYGRHRSFDIFAASTSAASSSTSTSTSTSSGFSSIRSVSSFIPPTHRDEPPHLSSSEPSSRSRGSEARTSGPSSSSSSSSSRATLDGDNRAHPSTLEEAKSRAWYLEGEEGDDAHPSPSSSSSSTVHGRPILDLSKPRFGLSNSNGRDARPRFTTFDPLRTTVDDGVPKPIRDLPLDAPEWLGPLHRYLTSTEGLNPTPATGSGGEQVTQAAQEGGFTPRRLNGAGDVIEGHTVVFVPTFRAVESEEVQVIDGPSGPLWDWVVIAVVKGTGRGVVGRADRAVRKWIRDNPSIGRVSPLRRNARDVSHKFPRIPEDCDWSLIGIPERRLCINLFTPEGRERWDLEELWTGIKRGGVRYA